MSSIRRSGRFAPASLSWILRTPREIAIADVNKARAVADPGSNMDQEESRCAPEINNLISATVIR